MYHKDGTVPEIFSSNSGQENVFSQLQPNCFCSLNLTKCGTRMQTRVSSGKILWFVYPSSTLNTKFCQALCSWQQLISFKKTTTIQNKFVLYKLQVIHGFNLILSFSPFSPFSLSLWLSIYHLICSQNPLICSAPEDPVDTWIMELDIIQHCFTLLFTVCCYAFIGRTA